jgi:hypothetical protein
MILASAKDWRPNQNLLGLIVGFGALGTGEYYRLWILCGFAAVVSVFSVFSVAATTIAYTLMYCKSIKSRIANPTAQ